MCYILSSKTLYVLNGKRETRAKTSLHTMRFDLQNQISCSYVKHSNRNILMRQIYSRLAEEGMYALQDVCCGHVRTTEEGSFSLWNQPWLEPGVIMFPTFIITGEEE